MNDAPRFSRPSLSVSIRPSGFFNVELPYGDPPAVLSELSRPGKLAEELRRTVRSLSNNAEKIRPRSPLMAAQCWHEAGRLLDHRAERLKEAWVCYSRALTVFPDHRPSLTALTALAERAGVDAIIGALLDARIDRASVPSEKTALLTKRAAAAIRCGDLETAEKHLRQATVLSKSALVPRILLAAIAAKTSGDKDVWSFLSPLHGLTKPSSVAAASARIAAEWEDRRIAEAVLPAAGEEILYPSGVDVSLPLLWIRLRTFLRASRREAAVRVIDEMLGLIDEGALRRTLRRFQNTLRMLSGELPADEANSGPAGTEDEAFYRFIGAQIQGSEKALLCNIESLRQKMRTKAVKGAFALYGMTKSAKPYAPNYFSFGKEGIEHAAASAVYRFLKMCAPLDTRDPMVYADALYPASNDPAALSAVLDRLREETPDLDAKWPIKVALTALSLGRFDTRPPAEPTQGLREEEFHRSPLPSIMRRTERRHRRLAELCLGEARGSDNPRFVASRLAWAGFHLETLDPFESARLYTEALACDPSLLFAVRGLERTGTLGREAATLYKCAAEAASDKDVRVIALLRGGILFSAAESLSEAAPMFGEAATLLLEDEGLSRIAFRLAQTYPKRAFKHYRTALLEARVKGVPPFLSGAFFLFHKPKAAAERFEEALSLDPADAAASLGRTEALLRAERASIVSEELFAKLKQSRDVFEEATIYLRLAHIDRFYRNDEVSAVMFADSLFSRLPGHRPTLIRLMVHALFKGRPEDFRRVLTALNLTLSHDEDAAAVARLCTLGDVSKPDLLRWVAGHAEPTILELTALEAVTLDKAERFSLLEKICARMPQSAAYLSRLADAMVEEGGAEEAVSLYKQSLESRLTVFYSLHRLAACIEASSSTGLVLDTLVNAADTWTIGPKKSRALFRAARYASEKTDDFEKAVDLCLMAEEADPENESALFLADTLLTSVVHNEEQHLRLLLLRLTAILDPLEEVVIRLKVRNLLERVGEGDVEAFRAEHLRAAVSAVRENRPGDNGDTAESEFAEVWDEEVWAAIRNVRLSEGSIVDTAFLSALGRMYLYELQTPLWAERYFEAALRVDPALPEALSGLGDILIKRGETTRASEVLSKLTGANLEPGEKLEKLLINAEILKDDLRDERQAEQVLLEARRTAPLALGPVEALAEIYEAQGDAKALSVHLATALSTFSAALADRPADLRLYENIRRVAARKGDVRVSCAASDMIAYLCGEAPTEPSATWTLRPGMPVADPSMDEQLCPKVISAGFRTALKALEIPLAHMLGTAADQVDVAGLERSKRRDKTAAMAAKLGPVLGAPGVEIRMGTTPDLRIALGTVPFILMPPAVFKSDSLGVKRFAAGAAFEWLRLGLALTTAVPASRFRRLLAGLCRIFISAFVPQRLREDQVAGEAAGIEAVVPKDLLDATAPFVSDLRRAVEDNGFERAAAAVGQRAGLLAAGSLPSAVDGLRAISGASSAPPTAVPFAGALLSFAFSSDFTDILKRLESK